MSSRIGLVSAVVVLGCLSLAQAQVVDQPQNAYAIITPESGDPAGLVLTETLTNGGLGGLGQTQVPPSPLLRKGALNVNIGTANEDSTGIAIVNPSTDVALVNLLVTDPQGIGILTQTFAIPPRGQISRFLSELFAGQIAPTTSSVGLLTITADVPVAILALNFSPFGFAAVQVVNLTSPVSVDGGDSGGDSSRADANPDDNHFYSDDNHLHSDDNHFYSEHIHLDSAAVPHDFDCCGTADTDRTGTISFGTVPNSAITTIVTKTPSCRPVFSQLRLPRPSLPRIDADFRHAGWTRRVHISSGRERWRLVHGDYDLEYIVGATNRANRRL